MNSSPPKRSRAKSVSDIQPPPQRKEYSQVASSEIPPSPHRRNSVSLPGGQYLPLKRVHTPDPDSTEYLHHITSPDNLPKIREGGGLMPHIHQPSKGVGLDESTGRRRPSVTDVVGNYLRVKREASQLPPQYQEMITAGAKNEAITALREGANVDNVYMSKGVGSTKDYMTAYFTTGAVLLRTKTNEKSGFIKDTQGKSDDRRALGLIIPREHLEYTTVSGEHMRKRYDDESWKFEDLEWKPL
jgi:hypothetical protein